MPESFDKKITIVSAGAGSGKTFSLCGKYYACVAEQRVEPADILATTFTKKAARELAQRFRRKLLDEGRAEEALLVESGRIGTVDSVCLALLTDFALDLGLSPFPATLADEHEKTVFMRAAGKTFEKYGEKLRGLAASLGMDGSLPHSPHCRDWRDTVFKLCGLARANGISSRDLKAQGKANAESFRAVLPEPLNEATASAKERKLRNEISTARKALRQNKEDKTGGTQDTRIILDDACGRDALLWLDWINLANAKPGAKSRDACKDFKELAAHYPTMPQYQDDLCDYIVLLFDCAADVLENYAAYKAQLGLLDYNDMEARTLELLRDEKVAKMLQERIRRVFVDEFQDTSPLQLALFLKFAEIAGESTWVGDTKQAIYGFRGTDPELMHEAARIIAADKPEILDTSYRSRESLVRFTNAFFANAFKPFGYGSELVELKVPENGNNRDGLPEGLRFWQAKKASSYDLLAKKIRQMLAAVPASENARPIAPGDIAVLCRKNEDCAKVAAALLEEGIAADSVMGGLLERPEVTLLFACYRLCLDKEDPVACLEIVRLLDPDIAAWLPEVLNTNDIADKKKALASRAGELLGADLAAVRRDLAVLSPHEALRRLMSVTDAIRLAGRFGDEDYRLANLDMLCGQALAYEDACHVSRRACSHSGFVRWLRDRDAEDGNRTDKKLVRAPGAENDAVHVLTYHKAKGLEWPVVILCSLDEAPKAYPAFTQRMMPPDEDFDLRDPLRNRKIHYWPWPCGAKNTLHDDIAGQQEFEDRNGLFANLELQESLRLLYVGMTRARDILVFFAGTKSTSSKPDCKTKGEPSGPNCKWLESVFPESVTLTLPTEETKCFTIGEQEFPVNWEKCDDKAMASPEDSGQASPAAPDTPMEPEGLVTLRGIATPPEGEKPPYPELEIAPSDSRRARAFASSFAVRKLGGVSAFTREGLPRELGSLVHAWLAIDLPRLTGKEKGDAAARLEYFKKLWRLGDEADSLAPLSACLMKELEDLAAERDLGRITAVRCEWPVYLQIGASHMSGRIDLFCECERGGILVDHKNIQEDASEDLYQKKAAEYSGQMALYHDALVGTGRANIVACLHLPIQGALIVYGPSR